MFGAEPGPVTGVDDSSRQIQSMANRRAATAGTFPFGLIARKACKAAHFAFIDAPSHRQAGFVRGKARGVNMDRSEISADF
jgi:hypothetical protein